MEFVIIETMDAAPFSHREINPFVPNRGGRSGLGLKGYGSRVPRLTLHPNRVAHTRLGTMAGRNLSFFTGQPFSISASEDSPPRWLQGAALTSAVLRMIFRTTDRKVVRIHANPMLASTAPDGDHDASNVASIAQLKEVMGVGQGGETKGPVYLAIVDKGIFPASLELALLKHGFPRPRRDPALVQFDYLPPPFSQTTPTHGTMCAFYACAMTPNATLLDIPVNAPQNGRRIDEATRVMHDLKEALRSRSIPGRLVVSNSWQTLSSETDQGIDPSSPDHCFNEAVRALDEAGADIVFSVPTQWLPENRHIPGPAGSPHVLTVSAADIKWQMFEPVANGPSEYPLDEKPDVTSYHAIDGFRLLGTPDEGTSVATALVAGIIAEGRARGMAESPDQMRGRVRRACTPLDPTKGFDSLSGYGIVDPIVFFSNNQLKGKGSKMTKTPDEGAGTAGPENDEGLLIFLVVDVLRDNELRQRFLAEPDAVVTEYNLAEDKIAALFSLDPRAVADELYEEGFNIGLTEVTQNYPVPEPDIKSFTPPAVPANTPTKLMLRGEGLPKRSAITFRETTSGASIEIVGTGSGRFADRKVELEASLPAGRYEVSIQIVPGGRQHKAPGTLSVS